MLDISKRLFSEWNNNYVLYCHWKSNEHLEEGLNGLTDLDVLVSGEDKTNCENVLLNLDFIKCKPQYGSRYPGVEDWLGCDTETGRLIHIHLHYQIITGHRGMKEYKLPWSQEALDTRIQDDSTGVYIMEPHLEIMTLYTRIALKASLKKIYAAKRGSFKLDHGDLKEIKYLKKRINLKIWGALIKKYYGSERVLGDLIEKEVLTSKDFLSLHRYITKNMKPYRTTNAFLSWLQKNYYKLVLPIRAKLKNKFNWLIINKKTPQKGGMMVAFIGQDGSGKSTVTNEILNWLTWKLEANKFYLGSGEHYHSWQKSLKPRIDKKKKHKMVAMASAWLTLSNHISVAKRTYKFVRQGKSYALNGGIAIFDRYPQTIHLGINDGPKIRFNYLDRISSPFLKKYVLYCAKVEEKYLEKAERVVPDIVFKLILPPEISMIRKPEENYEIIKKKHEIIKSLSFEQAKVFSIDATKEYMEEIKQIKGLIWGNLPHPEIIEFNGLAGCGKTTLARELKKELINRGYRTVLFGEAYQIFKENLVKNFIRYFQVPLFIQYIWCFLVVGGNQKYNFSFYIRYIYWPAVKISLVYHWCLKSGKFDFILCDHGLIQNFISLLGFEALKNGGKFNDCLASVLKAESDIHVVNCHVTVEQARKRIRSRNKNTGRLDTVSNDFELEKLLQITDNNFFIVREIVKTTKKEWPIADLDTDMPVEINVQLMLNWLAQGTKKHDV